MIEDTIKILSDLVAFDTIKDKENTEILDYIENFLKNLGFETQKREKYLIMSYGKNYRLGFIGHSDTVEYIDGWNTAPHTLTKVDGKLHGLGACDMKGGIACFLSTLKNTNLKKLDYGIKVYITYDEEIRFSGIKDIVSLNEKMPEYLLVGEPTDNIVMTGCKGLFALRIYTNGIKVHSSTPHKGKSANSSMVKLLTELEKYYEENIIKDKDEKFEIQYTTMNIGLIEGGSAINSVAAKCMSFIDFRTIKNEHVEKLKEKLDELCKIYDATYTVEDDIKTYYNDVDFIEDPHTAGFMTEASIAEAKNRLILGPGPVTAHETNEYITIDSINKTIEQYTDIIEQVCIK